MQYGYGGDPVVLDAEALASESLTLTAESEPNDAMVNANPIATDTEVTGSLEPAGADWYAVELASDTGWRVAAFGTNVLDEEIVAEVIPSAEFGGSFVAPGAQRQLSVEVGYSF